MGGFITGLDTYITIKYVTKMIGGATDSTINQPTTYETTSNDRTYDVYVHVNY